MVKKLKEKEMDNLEVKLLNHPKTRIKGGLKTMPFIIVIEAFEKMASSGLQANMIFYLMKDYHIEAASGSSAISIWFSFSSLLAIFGAFLSDSYLGRFRVIAIGSFSSLLGMSLLWLTAMVPQLKPLACDEFGDSICNSPTAIQLMILFSSFGLISIGDGCIGPCAIAFGADQIIDKENPNSETVLNSYFSWYYVSVTVSTMFALTIIVYIQDHLGWRIGFAVPALLMAFSASLFLLASPLYIKAKPNNSLLMGLIQVLVVAFKNRNVHLPSDSNILYHQTDESTTLVPSDNLRCLNKACIIKDQARDLNLNGSASNPWRICTVEQVETLKALLRIIPMWSAGFIFLSIPTQKFATLEANIMDRHITSNFEIPAGSFSLFLYISITLWLICYDHIVVPLLAAYTGKPNGLSPKVRIGIGLVVSTIAVAISGIVERIRRERAIKQGLLDYPNTVLNMSAMWLVPQYALFGIAEALVSVGQIEFFYTVFPKTMSSIAVSLWALGMGISSFVGGVLINIVDSITSKGGNISWLSSNLNKGRVDYFCWLMALLNMLNFVYYLICCRAYGNSEAIKVSSPAEEGKSDDE